MGNRKARRTAEASQTPSTASDIPLAQPLRGPSKHKTLLEIAAEKQSQLVGNDAARIVDLDEVQPELVTINPDGSLSREGESLDDAASATGLVEAVFYSVSLTMVYFTLDVLVHQQYAMSIDWALICWKTATALPVLLILTLVFHPRASAKWAQLLFLVINVAAGCYLVNASNGEPYFAVMKRAPPIGTLWIWSVIESQLSGAMAGLGLVGVFFWYGGYTIF